MRHLYCVISFIFVCLLSFKYAQGNQYCLPQIKAQEAKVAAKQRDALIDLKGQSSFQKDSIENSPAFRHVLKKCSMGSVLSFRRQEKQKHLALTVEGAYKPYELFEYYYIANFLYPKHVFW